MAETSNEKPRLLQFLPWCMAKEPVRLGTLELVPHRVGTLNPLLSREENAAVDQILRIYVGVSCLPKDEHEPDVVELSPVRDVLLAHWRDRPILEDTADGKIEEARELVDLLAFSCLANREFFSQWGYYCNRDFFAFYVHRFTRRGDSTTFTPRRLDGHVDKIVIHPRIMEPFHVDDGHRVEPDMALLDALLKARGKIGTEWERWIDAIRGFLAANTDSDATSVHQEIVFACGAFQRLVDSWKGADVAKRFAELVSTPDSILVADVPRLASQPARPDMSVRELWMLELHRARNAPAHGAGSVERTSPWLPREHLFLTAVAFPLLVKARLIEEKLYVAALRDSRQATALEPVAVIEDFFRPRPDGGFWWRNVLAEGASKRLLKELLESPERKEPPIETPT